ncbi:MAG: elongation factor G, partial [Spirochaetaceae bacterium]
MAGIRNIAFAGHGGTGKTSLVENILFAGGAISKPESVGSGKTVSDYTEEEIDNKMSIHTSLSHVTFSDTKINLLDTPGSSDFVGEVVAALRAAESACVVIAGKAGVQVETIKLWRRMNDRNMPRFVFVSKMDEERANYQAVLDDLAEKFQKTCVPVTIPMGSGADYKGVINLIEMKAYPAPGFGVKESATDIPAEFADEVEAARAVLIESAAEGDDELTEKYLLEENLTTEEIRRGITEGLIANKVVPVLCGAAEQGSGLLSLLSIIADEAPAPESATETLVTDDGEEKKIAIDPSAPFSAFVFKTSIDQFSGKLSFVKVVGGTLTAETDLVIAREKKKEKLSKVYSVQGKKLEEVSAIPAGDIGVLTKVAAAKTNDSLCAPEAVVNFKPLQVPQPVHAVAIEVPNRKDEDKLSDVMHRVVEEDMTFRYEINPETKETVISGMGESHLNMILDKLKEQQKIEVHTRPPKVAYRETITKPAEATYRHKKQTGGHGQFGEVSIKIRPLERGEHYQFDNLIRGMAVSKGYVPGIEKGLHEAMDEGFVAGYPAVDIGVELLDGKEHPVDSSEMAFKLASKGAMRDAASKAGPVLLEPIMNLEVIIEEQYLGDVLSDLNTRRGRVMGQEPMAGGFVVIKAQVPQSELLRYSIDLRSMTSGTGGFEMSFSHYNPISGKVADDVIKASQSAQEEA